MSKKFIEMVEDNFCNLMFSIDAEFDEYQIAIEIDESRWENPLPDFTPARMPGGGPEVMILAISGWTREESYWDESANGMHLVTAFGDDENYAFIPHGDIMGVLNSDGVLVYAKTYHYTDDGVPGVPVDRKNKVDEKAVKTSMEKMLEMNPKFKKKEK